MVSCLDEDEEVAFEWARQGDVSSIVEVGDHGSRIAVTQWACPTETDIRLAVRSAPLEYQSH